MRRAGLVIAGLFLTIPATSGAVASPEPVVVDPAGDANGINNQGQSSVPDQNVQTAPASIASADLTAIRLETPYSTQKDLDEEGRVVRVRYVPEALRLTFVTAAPAKPTSGPAMIFRMSATIGDEGCQVQFELWIAGSAPGTGQTERADVNRLRSCPGGVGVLTEGFTYAFDGNESSLTFPFDKTQGMLAAGVRLDAYTSPHTRTVTSLLTFNGATLPAIDQTAPIAPFVLGSDVPPDVDCLAQPDHPVCT